VEIEGLHKHFGILHVLNGIDLSVGTGEVVCIIGPSGSGNRRCCAASTTLRCQNEGASGSMASSLIATKCKEASVHIAIVPWPRCGPKSEWCFSTSTYFRT